MITMIHNRPLSLSLKLLMGCAFLALAAPAHSQTAQCRDGADSGSTECGTGAVTAGPDNTAIGNTASATGDRSTALGMAATAAGAHSTAVGQAASASPDDSTAIGGGATTNAPAGTAVGAHSSATGTASTAVGIFATAATNGSFAGGVFSTASGTSSIVLGQFSEARGADSIAVGGNSAFSLDTFEGQNANTGTRGAYANGIGAVVIGGQARVGTILPGPDPFTPGDPSLDTAANFGTAIGFQSTATATNATAIGATARAGQAGATAIGFGATTTAANQVALGAAGSSVRIGDIAASNAAQTGVVAVATVDANGTLGRNTTLVPAVTALQSASGTQAGQITALQSGQAAQASQITALQSGQTAMSGRMNTLFDLADVNRREIRKANEGVAMALAMETPALPAGARVGVAGGFGYYNDRVAGTAAFAVRVGDRSAISGGIGVGMNTGEVGARAGFQAAW